MKTGILIQEYNEGRQIVMDYENDKISHEEAMNRLRIRAQERAASKKIIAIALGFAKLNEKKIYTKISKILMGTGTQNLKIEPPEKMYDRTIDRGRNVEITHEEIK